MSEVATFFRHREKDTGETYQFQIEGPKEVYRVSVYSRKAMQSARLRSRSASDRKDLELALKDLRKDLAAQGGGGWMVTSTDEGSSRQLTVTAVGGSNFEPPRQFFMLSPGRPATMLQTSNKTHRVPLGSHVIVPVDEDADDILGHFLGYLSWLPADLESVVLNTIRRPSLEVRLNRVEAELALRTSDEGQRRDWKLGLRRAIRSTTFLVTAVSLLIALGIAGWLIVHFSKDESQKSAVTTDATSHATTDTTVATHTGPNISAPATTLADDTRQLLRLLEARGDKEPAFKLLYDNHFKGLHISTDNEVEDLFKSKTRRFFWGLIKLQALELEPELLKRNTPELTFMGVDEVTATKEVFANIGRDALQDTELNFLAAVACRLGYKTPQAPGLPQTPAPADTPSETQPFSAFEFVPGGKCTNYTDADIQRGLKGLYTFVEKPQ